MKRMRPILAWLPTLVLLLVLISATRIQPGIEKWLYLTQHMSNMWVGPSPFTLSQSQVEAVFRDRLSDFSPAQAPKLAAHVIQLCEQHGFDPAFVLSVIQVESSFRTRAVSPVGAIGLMQIMPATAEYVAERWNLAEKSPVGGSVQLRNPFTNISIGVTYLAFLRDRYNGEKSHFLAAYLAGPGKIDQILDEDRDRIQSKVYREYVDSIQREFKNLKEYRFKAPEPKIFQSLS